VDGLYFFGLRKWTAGATPNSGDFNRSRETMHHARDCRAYALWLYALAVALKRDGVARTHRPYQRLSLTLTSPIARAILPATNDTPSL
jgi:hypothetical protein